MKQYLIDAMITFNNRPDNVGDNGENIEYAQWHTLRKVDGEWLVEFRTAEQTHEVSETRVLGCTLKTSLLIVNSWSGGNSMIIVR